MSYNFKVGDEVKITTNEIHNRYGISRDYLIRHAGEKMIIRRIRGFKIEMKDSVITWLPHMLMPYRSNNKTKRYK